MAHFTLLESRRMTRPYFLLSPEDRHRPGDEIFLGFHAGWKPVPEIHHGELVGTDSAPCRRKRREAPPRTRQGDVRRRKF